MVCIPSTPDIVTVGVRAAVYVQSLLSFILALWALSDSEKKLTHNIFAFCTTQSTMTMILPFALLLSTAVQSLTQSMTNYHATIILNLSWINTTNTLIYLLLFFYRRPDIASIGASNASGSAKLEDVHIKKSSTASPQKLWKEEMRQAMRNPILAVGSMHLCLMAEVGIWFWLSPNTFGLRYYCDREPLVVVFSRNIPIGSRSLQLLSLLIYSAALVPGFNLIVASSLFDGIVRMYKSIVRARQWQSKERCKDPQAGADPDAKAWGDGRPVIFCLIFLMIITVFLIVDTEQSLAVNAPLLSPKDNKWSFSQTLSLLLLLIPFRNFIKSK